MEGVHLLGVLLVDHLRAFSPKLPYNHLSIACRALTHSAMPAAVRLNNSDETGQNVFRVLLVGTVLVQRREFTGVREDGGEPRASRRAAAAEPL